MENTKAEKNKNELAPVTVENTDIGKEDKLKCTKLFQDNMKQV